MKIATVGLDIAKQSFQVHAADSEGRAVLRKRLRRDQVADVNAHLELPRSVRLELPPLSQKIPRFAPCESHLFCPPTWQ